MIKLLEILAESALDTLKIIPSLYLIYLLVSFYEHNTDKFVRLFNKTKKIGPIIGSVTGSIPQCGFSVAMSDLYSKKSIDMGTLLAVFIATSDEAIPIMISNHSFALDMLLIVAIKFVYAIFCGYLVNLFIKILSKNKKKENKEIKYVCFNAEHNKIIENPNSEISYDLIHSHSHCACDHLDEHDENHHSHKHQYSHEHNHNHSEHKEHHHEEHSCNCTHICNDHCCANNIFLSALIHTLKIASFILIINIVLGIILEFSGLDITFLSSIKSYIQPFITSLIGLIPNCAGSVLLVELYMAGGITFGSLLAGLSTGAGVGLIVLFKRNSKNLKQNLIILFLSYFLGVILGLAVNLFTILI